MRQRGAAKKRRSLTIRSFVKVFCWYAVWPHRRGPCTGRTGRYSTAAGKLRCTAPALCAHRNKDRSLWGPRRPSILPTGSVWGAAVPSHHLLFSSRRWDMPMTSTVAAMATACARITQLDDFSTKRGKFTKEEKRRPIAI